MWFSLWFSFVVRVCFLPSHLTTIINLLAADCSQYRSALCSIPGMVHLLFGEADGSSHPALPSHRLQHPGEGKSLSEGVILLRTLRLHLLRKVRLHPQLWTAPSVSAFTFKSASRGGGAGRSPPSHRQGSNIVFLSWRKTLGIQMGA